MQIVSIDRRNEEKRKIRIKFAWGTPVTRSLMKKIAGAYRSAPKRDGAALGVYDRLDYFSK